MTDRPPHEAADARPRFAMVYESAFARFRNDKALTPVCMMVYLALVFRASAADRRCFPSVATIAKDAGCSKRAVVTSLQSLKDAGLIAIERRYVDENRQSSNTYTILETGAKSAPPTAKSAPTPLQNLHPPGAKSAPELEPEEPEPENDTSGSATRKRRIPEDFQITDSLREYARSKGLTDTEIDDEHEGFTLHFQANGVPMLDWDKTWMRWMREAKRRQHRYSPNGKKPITQPGGRDDDYLAGIEGLGGVKVSRHRND